MVTRTGQDGDGGHGAESRIEELLWIRLERPLTVEEQLEYEGHVEEARSTRWPRGG